MTGSVDDYSDPLLSRLHKVLQTNEEGVKSGLMLALANEIDRAKQRRSRIDLSGQEDPVVKSIARVLQRERIRLDWDKIAFLGCSAGGDVALRSLFGYLSFPHIPIVIAMHHHPKFKFLMSLDMASGVRQTPLPITEDMAIHSNTVYFVPGDRLVSYSRQDSSFHTSPVTVKKRFRPVIDDIFALAGQHFGTKSLGIIMTGMLYDGAAGLKDMYLNQAECIVQDPGTAVFKDMPQAALERVPGAKVRSLKGIADRINLYSSEGLRASSMLSVFAGKDQN